MIGGRQLCGERRLAVCLTVAALAAFLPGCQSLSVPWKKQTAPSPPPPSNVSLPHLEDEKLAFGQDADAATLTPKQKAGVQLYVGSQFERNNEPQRAMETYREVIRKDPTCAEAYHRLAILKDKAGQSDEAFKLFHEAIRREPKNAEYYCDLGYSLYLQRRWKESETNLRHALELQSSHTRAHNNLGLVLARTERYDEALSEFSRVGCCEAEARANLAHALMLESRWADAEAQCERALASKNLTPEMQAKLSRLRTVARAEAKAESTPRAQSG